MLPLKLYRCSQRVVSSLHRGMSSLSNGTLQCHQKLCSETKYVVHGQCRRLQFPTHLPCLHNTVNRKYCTSEQKDDTKKEPMPPVIFNVTFPYMFNHIFALLFHGRLVKLAKLNTKNFFDGITMAFLSVHNGLVDGTYGELEDMLTRDLFIKIKNGEGYLSPNLDSIYQIEQRDVVSMTLAQLQIHRDKLSGLE